MAPQYGTAELPVTDRDHSTSVVAAVASLLFAVAATDSFSARIGCVWCFATGYFRRSVTNPPT